jgi:hypothetical protein
MRSAQPRLPRFLVEWYLPHVRSRAIDDIAQCMRTSLATLPLETHPPELLYAVAVPADGYAFGVFAADCADAVTRACQAAGLAADRVSAAVESSSP